MPDTAAPEVASQAPVPLARARGHHRRLAAGSAAAALIVAALLAAGLLVLAPISSTEASPLAAAAEKTAAALRQSGRADATVSIDYAGERGQPGHRALGVLRRGHLDRPRLRHCPRHRPDPELRRRRVVLLPADLRQPHVAVDPPQRSARGRDAGRRPGDGPRRAPVVRRLRRGRPRAGRRRRHRPAAIHRPAPAPALLPGLRPEREHARAHHVTGGVGRRRRDGAPVRAHLRRDRRSGRPSGDPRRRLDPILRLRRTDQDRRADRVRGVHGLVIRGFLTGDR